MASVRDFVKKWIGRGYEKGDTQIFWLQFLRDVLNISQPEKFIKFEVPVKLKHTSFIDAFFPDSKVIIEQKSLSENLTQEKSQSDGSILTPYEQAQRYGNSLPYSMRPRWIIVSNFKEFLIYDMETLEKPQKILLEDLPQKFHVFDFLIDASQNKIRVELELSLQAGEIVGKLYDALHVQYINPNSDESLQSLNKLCVRLVFCLYAESADIFGKHNIFFDYLKSEKNLRRALIDLFQVLNTPINLRDPYLADELKNFPYVNGGLFEGNIEIPNFSDDIKNLLLEDACAFNWAGISPTIFGAVFESTLNPVTRRAGGMHYTSIENIHKVIDSLFLDDLTAEFENIHGKKNLLKFQDKISQLKFFDPACGSGNFLTESFICLRRLENKILRELLGSQITLGDIDNPVKVSISQFSGIEINDFACTVARTALWIAELQMLQETQNIIHRHIDTLPLKSYANIFEGNALKIDWDNLAHGVNFIMGNPPFVGKTFQTTEQKADIKTFFKNNSVDYVACWYKKAADFIQGTRIESAFVSTNSITQGEQVAAVFENLPIEINFAHKTFIWDSESNLKAHVHCVIIGFANFARPQKFIFDGNNKILAQNINFYLNDAPNFFIHSRNKPLRKDTPPMVYGNKPADGGFLILSPIERDELLKKYPAAEKFIRQFMGAEEFLHGKKRYCLWLVNATPAEIKKIPPIYDRVKNVRDFRLKSKKAATLKDADRPTEFQEIRLPQTGYILVPRVSSENRRYIPMDFLPPEIIPSDANFIIPDATIYHFGILISSVHMAWTRAVCGRLESRYRYSAQIVYNNFPFCNANSQQVAEIEITAQNILDTLKKYPDSTLAELYDDVLMPKDLRDAHRKNDAAVLAAYNFPADFSESEIVSNLMQRNGVLTQKKTVETDINFLPLSTTAREIISTVNSWKYYYFGVLTSSVHMAWVKIVAGRLKSDFRYSAQIVYNNFVWCQPSIQQKRTISKTAQNILNVRKNYPDSTLAELYDDILMPKDLRDAHRKNDVAVLAAYNFPADFSESEIVSNLMQRNGVVARGNS